jgi:hypothetical protein
MSQDPLSISVLLFEKAEIPQRGCGRGLQVPGMRCSNPRGMITEKPIKKRDTWQFSDQNFQFREAA